MNFQDLSLAIPLLDAVKAQGYEIPSPIQQKAIPVVLNGDDLLASAQTGTGKTAGFVLPILHQLLDKPRAGGNRTLVLILTPTRELAAQVHEDVRQCAQFTKIRSAVVFGGVNINPQMLKLRSGVEVLVATPGRLLDLVRQNAIRLDAVKTFVLDEADRMLDMGFIHDIRRVMALLPKRRQNLLFSATFSPEIRALAKSFLHQPVEVSVTPPNSTVDKIKQTIHPVDKAQKAALLCHLAHSQQWRQALIFSRTKHGANKLVKILAGHNIEAAAIHGNKSQSQRTQALDAFKTGKIRLLVATDIAARGIDIDQLPLVVNFDLPQVPEDYVHRIGRTGRAGSSGVALSLVSADEAGLLHAIEKITKKRLNRVEIDDFEPEHRLPEQLTPAARSSQGPRRQSAGRRR